MNSGSLDAIMRIHDWTDQVQTKTVDMSHQMSRVLRGKWLTTKGTHAHNDHSDVHP